MIILAVATEITLLQEKLNLPRYCIGQFFFFTLTDWLFTRKIGNTHCPDWEKSTSGWRASDKNVFA